MRRMEKALGTAAQRHSGTATKEGLRDDLERFVFLLGGSDGESLLGPRRLT